MTDKLATIFETYRMAPHEAALKSKDWFNQQLFILGQTQANSTSLMMQGKSELKRVNKITPGSMYLFKYNPKYAKEILAKKENAYYDIHPLIIPFRQVPGGFYGLNLHYLTPQLRVALLDKLMIYASNKNLDENTKLRFTWQMAVAAAKNKYISSCVHMYLMSQLQSQFMFIKPDDWVSALMLPVESFVGANKALVWKESRRI